MGHRINGWIVRLLGPVTAIATIVLLHFRFSVLRSKNSGHNPADLLFASALNDCNQPRPQSKGFYGNAENPPSLAR